MERPRNHPAHAARLGLQLVRLPLLARRFVVGQSAVGAVGGVVVGDGVLVLLLLLSSFLAVAVAGSVGGVVGVGVGVGVLALVLLVSLLLLWSFLAIAVAVAVAVAAASAAAVVSIVVVVVVVVPPSPTMSLLQCAVGRFPTKAATYRAFFLVAAALGASQSLWLLGVPGPSQPADAGGGRRDGGKGVVLFYAVAPTVFHNRLRQ